MCGKGKIVGNESKAENDVNFGMWVKLFIGIMALDDTTQRLFGGN